MNRYRSITFLLLFMSWVSALAQKSVNPHFETHRLDYRDLGYPGASLIPADDSPITSLLTHSNGQVYGATSGKQAYLFRYDNKTNKVYPLGKLPKAEGVRNSLVEGAEGKIYIGSGKNEIVEILLSKDVPYGRRSIENQLWADIDNRYKGFEGGSIYEYDPKTGDEQIYLSDDEAQVKLLAKIPESSIYCMTINAEKNKLYAITYPDAEFIEFNIENQQLKQHGPWLTSMSYAGPERTWRSVPRDLICLPDGRIFSSGDQGLMTYFDPKDEKVHGTTMRIPGEYWITQKYEGYPVVEQLLSDDSGNVIGSTSDGFLFKMLSESDELMVIGKPMVERRIRAMTLGGDDKVYLIAGERTHVCRLFSYDLSSKQKGFEDYGVLGVDRSPYYAKIGYQFDAMCTAADGTIFIGESDRRAKLFFYIPGGSVLPGTLNPTNPR